MGLFIKVTADVYSTPNSGGNTFLGQFQANVPGQGQTQVPHEYAFAQTIRFICGEPVPVAPGSEGSVTLANLNTALTACVADLASASGTPIITPAALAQIQGWQAGNP